MIGYLWAVFVGAILTNVRYYFVIRSFNRRYFIVPKTHNLYRYLLSTHFKGQTRDGQKFVFCPVSLRTSWSPGDYDHEWCHACQLFFSDHVEQLLEPHERDALRAL